LIYANKPFGKMLEFYLENHVLFWKLVSYCIVLFIWIFEKTRNWFDIVWSIFAKSIKEKEKQKIERVTEQKKKGESLTGPTRDKPAQQGKSQPSSPRPTYLPEPVPPLFFPPLSYTWTPPVRSSSTLVLPAPETAAVNASWFRPFPSNKSSNETTL
jgi:hypothetical protein